VTFPATSSGRFLLKAGEWKEVTPDTADWQYLSFRVVRSAVEADTGEEEIALVPLGGRCRVESGGERWEIGGREHVFAGLPRALYLPRDTPYRVESIGPLDLAVCGALCDEKLRPPRINPHDVEVEVRGAGNATRQINHIIPPDFPAQRLLVVEVYTPAGNWSSYPPHKHDEDRPPSEVVLEETYYFRAESRAAFAVQRLYSPRHRVDVTETVRDGDLMLVPYGYHTTCAAHGYDLYYLNALAGDRRSMAASDDPDLAWLRSEWKGMQQDPRVPLVT
jgi:5-deoxy-glucuronate isomerase